MDSIILYPTRHVPYLFLFGLRCKEINDKMVKGRFLDLAFEFGVSGHWTLDACFNERGPIGGMHYAIALLDNLHIMPWRASEF